MRLGRPTGLPKTGGRRAGVPNKVTKVKAAKLAESGLMPLDYMLSVVRDESAPRAERMDAAKGAAPFCHPKLAAVTHSGAIGTFDLTKLTDDELTTLEPILVRLALSGGGAGGDREAGG